jgi:hypothetical protein
VFFGKKMTIDIQSKLLKNLLEEIREDVRHYFNRVLQDESIRLKKRLINLNYEQIILELLDTKILDDVDVVFTLNEEQYEVLMDAVIEKRSKDAQLPKQDEIYKDAELSEQDEISKFLYKQLERLCGFQCIMWCGENNFEVGVAEDNQVRNANKVVKELKEHYNDKLKNINILTRAIGIAELY